MDLNKFNEGISKLYDGQELANDELADLDYMASALLDKMADETIDYDSQNALDLYISYFDGSRYLDPSRTNNVMRYYNIIEERHNKTLQREKENKPKVLQKLPINNDGIIGAIAIIEVVFVVGVLIAFLAVAFLSK